LKEKNEYPCCFGKLDNVFPMEKNGLRNTPESCLGCFCKTECLRSAMGKSGGLKVKEENLNRAYDAGMLSFWERWSQKKEIHRRLKSLNKGKT
jgi:hypothetical protein